MTPGAAVTGTLGRATKRTPSLVPTLIVLLPLWPALWPLLTAIGPAARSGKEADVVWELDACGLLTRAEVEDVLGEPVTAIEGSGPDRSAVPVARCFYTAANFSNSVSLEVALPRERTTGKTERQPPWTARFDAAVLGNGKEPLPLRPVPGLGDEAFWSGNGMAGALYVRKDDAALRLDLGGSREASAGIDKASRLARTALARL